MTLVSWMSRVRQRRVKGRRNEDEALPICMRVILSEQQSNVMKARDVVSKFRSSQCKVCHEAESFDYSCKRRRQPFIRRQWRSNGAPVGD